AQLVSKVQNSISRMMLRRARPTEGYDERSLLSRPKDAACVRRVVCPDHTKQSELPNFLRAFADTRDRIGGCPELSGLSRERVCLVSSRRTPFPFLERMGTRRDQKISSGTDESEPPRRSLHIDGRHVGPLRHWVEEMR